MCLPNSSVSMVFWWPLSHVAHKLTTLLPIFAVEVKMASTTVIKLLRRREARTSAAMTLLTILQHTSAAGQSHSKIKCLVRINAVDKTTPMTALCASAV